MDQQINNDSINPSLNLSPLSVHSGGDVLSFLFSGMPNVIIPRPFSLSDPSLKVDLDKLKSEAMDKEGEWDRAMTTFFGEYEEYVDSWRVMNRRMANRPKALFNSKSGETHRAVETVGTVEFSMLTNADPFYYAYGEGLDDFGNEVSEIQLQGVEQVLRKQFQYLRWKEKFMRALRSKALFGTMIVECPWISFPYGDGEKSFEGTDFIPRSLLTTGFDPTVFDLDQSDFIFTLDYPTIRMVRNWAKNDPKNWNMEEVERIYSEHKTMSQGGSDTSVYYRVTSRKQRAGYNILGQQNFELLSYHGRVDTDNDVINRYWESEQRQDEPSLCDFSFRILHGSGIVSFNATPFKTWHHRFKTAHSKLFEMEPLAYGIGKIGRKRQRELDQLESRTNDLIMFNVLPMWKIGKYAGVDVSKLTIKPWNFVELENIDQLQPIQANIAALPYSLNMQSVWKEDFRTMNAATGNLQGTSQAGSATEAGIIQNESMRAAEVMAEITADVFLRDYLQTCHINNTRFMDNGFWVKTMAFEKPFYVNKDNMPFNVGFYLKLTTDKNSRPQTIQNILQALQMATSFRNSPTAMNVIEPLWQSLFRALQMDVRLLTKPLPMAQQMLLNMQMQQNQQNVQGQMTDAQSMQSGAAAGNGGAQPMQTPVGPVLTSPINQQAIAMSP